MQRRNCTRHTCGSTCAIDHTQRTADRYSRTDACGSKLYSCQRTISIAPQHYFYCTAALFLLHRSTNEYTLLSVIHESLSTINQQKQQQQYKTLYSCQRTISIAPQHYFYCTAALFLLHRSTNEYTLLSL
jgi:hypothetical protein